LAGLAPPMLRGRRTLEIQVHLHDGRLRPHPAAQIAQGVRMFVAEDDFWRDAIDPRDFSTQQQLGPVDNFVLKFRKPL
jgi:hypothetical protein